MMNEVCAGVLLFLLAFALYSNTLRAGFVYDDTRAILGNTDLHADTPWSDLLINDFWGTPLNHSGSHKSYRPISVATFRLNHLFSELEPFGYHLVNVILHGIVSVLFYHFTKYIFGDRVLLRIIATLLFIVHPIHTEAVASVVGRAEILACLFFLLSLMSYLRSVHCSNVVTGVRTVCTEFNWGWLACSMLMAVLALFSKEQGVTVLGVCAVIDVFIISKVKVEPKQLILIITKPQLSGLRKRLIIIFLVLLGLVCVRFYVMGNTPPFFSPSDNPAAGSDSLLTRTLTFLYLPTFNVWLLLYPATLSFDWSMEAIPLINSLNDIRNIFTMIWYSCLAAIVLACITNLRAAVDCTAKLDKSQVLLIGLSVLVLPFIPATNLFFYVGFVVAERILYIPSVGFCLLAGKGIHTVYHMCNRIMKKVLLVLVVFFLVLFAIRTYERNGDWIDEETLYKSGIGVNPAKAYGNLANVWSKKGNNTAAEQAYRNALHYRPNMADAHYNLGTLLYGEKRYQEALESFQKATTFRPSLAAAHLNLGMTLSALGRHQEAEEVLKYCATISSERLKDPKAHMSSVTSCLFNLGNLYMENKRYQEAVNTLHEALRKKPRDYSAQGIYNILGKAYDNMGEVKNAEHYYQLSIREKPNHLPVIINYSRFLVAQNRIQEAKELLLAGTRYNPDRHEVYASLGEVMIQSGDTGKGIEAFERAVQLAPNDENLLLSAAHRLREAKLYDRAEKFYKLATMNAPQSFDAHANYGAFLHLTKQYTLAHREYSKALEINPTDNVTRLNLSKLNNVMNRKHS